MPGQLAARDYYVITVAYSHFGETWEEVQWTKETSWLLSERRYLLDLSDDDQFRWAVRVLERTGEFDANGKPVGIARSPLSEVRTFAWTASTSPAPTSALPNP